MNFDRYDESIRELIGNINRGLSEKDEQVVKSAENLIVTACTMHDMSLEGYARYMLALSFYRFDYPEEKIREALNKAIIFLTPADDRILIASAYNMLGILESINNRQNLSMDYFITALSYCDEDDEESFLKKFTIESNISYLYYSAGEVDYAIALASDTINALVELAFVDERFQLLLYRLYCTIGVFYCEIEEPNLNSAEKYLSDADNSIHGYPDDITADKDIIHTNLLIMINFFRQDKNSYDENISRLLDQIGNIINFTDSYSDVFMVIEFLIDHEEYFSAGKIIQAISGQVKSCNFLGIHANFDELMINYLEGSGMEQSANEASHRYYKRIREKKPGDVGAMLYSLNLRRDMQHMQIEGERLKYAAIREKAANEAKTAFLSNMSHELRTPINAILGMDEMIIRESNEKTILEYAENIQSAGNSLLSIINDILDFSKIEAGKLDIIPDDYHFSVLLNTLLMMLRSKARDKNLTLDFEIDESIPDKLYGDEMRIRQVLLNLLNNAVKYTEKGGVVFRVSYEKAGEEQALITFHVIDTGIGIKSEDFERLFSPFERIDVKKNKTIEGTGLGISITTKLLKLMNSELEVDSEYAKGSDFHFTLSQKVTDWEPMGDFIQKVKTLEPDIKKNNQSFSAPNARVLVVDDTEMNLMVIQNLLKRTRMKVDTALSGMQALEMIEKADYDIIFMDHRMPIMDGIETFNNIKSRPKNSRNYNTPEVMLTADAIVGMEEKFISCGFDLYLAKPVDSAALESAILKLLPEELISDPIEDDNICHISTDHNSEESVIMNGLKDLAIMDTESAVSACGDISTFIRVAKSFFESAPSKIMEITEAIENDDISLYTTKVHALKSSARLCGLHDLSEAAKALEEFGNKQRDKGLTISEEIISNSQKLLKDFENISQKIAKAYPCSSVSEEAKPEIELDELYDAYRIIYEYNESFDIGSIDELMKKLSEYKIPSEEKNRFEQLKLYVNEVNNDEISKLLEPIVPIGGIEEG